MNLLKSYNPIILTSCALALSACTNLHPIREVGPYTYQVKHSMGKNSPVTGVRSGLIKLAQDKCTEENAPYNKVREEMTSERYLTYILTFSCKQPLEGSRFTGSLADRPADTSATEVAPEEIVSTIPVSVTIPSATITTLPASTVAELSATQVTSTTDPLSNNE